MSMLTVPVKTNVEVTAGDEDSDTVVMYKVEKWFLNLQGCSRDFYGRC